MEYLKHPHSLIESKNIGKKTQIGPFCHIFPEARIGEQCTICNNVIIENNVTIGNRVTIKDGVHLCKNVEIEDDVYIGPNATFSESISPTENLRNSFKTQKNARGIIIRKKANIGANATIYSNIEVGENSVVEAGAVVSRNVPSNAIVSGNPAIIIGYINYNKIEKTATELMPPTDIGEIKYSKVKGVKVIRLPTIKDLRGNLSFAEYGQYLPFIPKRYFLVYDVDTKEVRGEHAHKTLHQFLVCVNGSCAIVVDDGLNREEVLLNSLDIGLYIPPKIWAVQYKYSADGILLVLASDVYKPNDYIRNYNEFIKMVKPAGKKQK